MRNILECKTHQGYEEGSKKHLFRNIKRTESYMRVLIPLWRRSVQYEGKDSSQIVGNSKAMTHDVPKS